MVTYKNNALLKKKKKTIVQKPFVGLLVYKQTNR